MANSLFEPLTQPDEESGLRRFACRPMHIAHISTLVTCSASATMCLLVVLLSDRLVGKLAVLITSTLTLLSCLRCMAIPSVIPIEEYNVKRETWFGHHMSQENEIRHIPVVLCATYSFVYLYGALVSLISPQTSLITIPLFYVAGLMAFYAWHVGAHILESTELHRMHMEHHQDRYPQQDFYGDCHPQVQKERQDRLGKPNTLLSLMGSPAESMVLSVAHEGPLALAMILIVFIGKGVFLVSTVSCMFALFGYGFMASLGSAIHMSFHERNFEWEPYACYRELRSLHMIHHMDRKNYAMVNILLDLAFGSLALRG